MIVASPRAGGNLTLNVDALGRPEPGSRSVRDPNDSADPECILAVMPEGAFRDFTFTCTAAPALCQYSVRGAGKGF